MVRKIRSNKIVIYAYKKYICLTGCSFIILHVSNFQKSENSSNISKLKQTLLVLLQQLKTTTSVMLSSRAKKKLGLSKA